MKIKQMVTAGILTSSIFGVVSAASAHPTPVSSASSTTKLSKTDQNLQNQINELKLVLSENASREMAKQKVDQTVGIGTHGFLNDRIVFSGGVLSQLSASKYANSSSFTGGAGRNLELNTAYLNVHAIVTQNLSAFTMISTVAPGEPNVDGGTGGVEFEEAYLNYAKDFGPNMFNVQIGRTYVPFGVYKIHPIVASLTQTLDQTNRPAAILGFARSPIFFSVYGFGGLGNLNKSSSTLANKLNGGARIGSSYVGNHWGYDVSADYITNMAEALSVHNILPTTYNNVPNFAAHATGTLGGFALTYNFSRAVRPFSRRDLIFNGGNARPQAQEVELSFTSKMFGHRTTLAANYQTSKEALALDLPKNRIAASVDCDVNHYLTVTLEGLRNKDYSSTDSYQRLASGSLTAVQNGTGRVNYTGILEADIHF
ncbi:MAG: hypothetical protein CMF39_04075 [Legionellaceae bacterium]|nr:hypothetical protein [Legionellaceae bacterium]|tara:strand:- start:369 stop:1649 length:1281 start_codon:yes stop_codon:yes gene_type:complete